MNNTLNKDWWQLNTGASDRLNLLVVALSKATEFIVHDDTQVTAAVARVFHTHVGEMQVPYSHATLWLINILFLTDKYAGTCSAHTLL